MPKLYLIDKAKLLSDIWDDLAFLEGAPVSARDAAKYLDNLVRKQPTIEAAPVRNGRWKKKNGEIYCTNCKKSRWSESFELLLHGFSFCPNCGARMDERGADNG